jgi:hypothetical protein
VLDNGRLVEQGTHAELLALPDGLYRRLHAMQFRWDVGDETAVGLRAEQVQAPDGESLIRKHTCRGL